MKTDKYLVKGRILSRSEYSGRNTEAINQLSFDTENIDEAKQAYIDFWEAQPTASKYEKIEVLAVYQLVYEKGR